MINKKGAYIIQPNYTQLTELQNGLAMVVKDSLYGYVNQKGEEQIPIQFNYVDGVINWGLFNSKKYARVVSASKFGLIDTAGAKFIPCLFEDVGAFSEGLIAIKRHGKWGFCDEKTKLRIPYNYNSVTGFNKGLAIVNLNGKYGVIDVKGNMVIPTDYDEINWFQNNYFKVKKEELYGIISITNQPILPTTFTDIEITNDKKLLKLSREDGFTYQYINQVFKTNE